MSASTHSFPVLRWVCVVWMLVWFPAYFHYWGWINLLHLCDVAVILAFFGVWFASPLLLSSQAVASLAAGIFWLADVSWKLITHRYLIGGTEYMWDAHYPLWLRLLSMFHIALPIVLLYALRKLGYDRRGFALQSAIAVVLLILSRLVAADLNMNYAYRDPLWHHAYAPAPLHVALVLAAIVFVIYLPTHFLLMRLFPGIKFAVKEEANDQAQAILG